LHQGGEEVESEHVKTLNEVRDALRLPLGEGCLKVWEFESVLPVMFAGSAQDLEDSEDLINLRVAVEHWFLLSELGEDAPDRPGVNSNGVSLLAEKDLRSSVP